MEDQILLSLAAIGFIGIACQWFAWHFRLPSIIFLLIAGILVGPVTGFINPDELFGDLLFPIVSLGVAVILFEGGLTLRLDEIRGQRRVLRNLLVVGVILTWGISAAGAHYLMHFSWEVAFLFGALMTVTGPTVIKPLLRTIRPRSEIANILHWEGIILDVVGAILTVLVYQYIVTQQIGETIPVTLFLMILTGLTLGAAGAWLLASLLRRHLLPHYLHHVFSLALVLMIFAISNSLIHESGLLAVTLMGMMLANMKGIDIEDILFFKESLSVLLISVLFVVLAARLEISPLLDMGWTSLAMLALIMLVARPVSVMLSTMRSRLDWRARVLLAWVAPRGIVAAAVSALFALRLEELGHEEAGLLVPLTFLVIIGTVLLQGITARPLARRLKVMEPEPNGILILGANPLARAIAATLNSLGVITRLADTGWENVRRARMEGLDSYFGRVVSERAERNLNLSGIGKLLAISPNSSMNALAMIRFKNEFGAENVYYLMNSEEDISEDVHGRHFQFTGRQLFTEETTYAELAGMLSEGAKIHTTKLSEKFDFYDYREKYRNSAVLLFAVDPKSKLHFFTARDELLPETDWSICGLIPGELLEQENGEATINPGEASPGTVM
ncbi:MAG: sodium:proton antiporter [Gammaproteobacteria bacterium]|jgi:NhaP-type Na+/H+ or K+/H+ antiporter